MARIFRSAAMGAILGCVSLGAAAAAPIARPAVRSEDAVAYQINVAHSGSIALANGFTTPLKQIWSMVPPGPVKAVSYPLIADGKVFFTVGYNCCQGSNGTLLYALDAATGAVVWEDLIPGVSGWSNAAYDRGHLFVIDDAGEFQSIRAATGQSEWSIGVPGALIYSAPVAKAGQVFANVSGSPGATFAVNEKTGAIQWEESLPYYYPSVGAPSFGDQGVYVTYGRYPGASFAVKFDPVDGKSLWEFSQCLDYSSPGLVPVYYDKRFFYRNGSCQSDVLNAESGNVESYFTSSTAPAFFQNGTILTLTGGVLDESNLKSGLVKWSFVGDGQLSSAPIVVNGLVIEGSLGGNLYVLDGTSGNLLWSTNVGAPIPQPNEFCCSSGPLTGLAAGGGILVVPSATAVTAFAPQ